VSGWKNDNLVCGRCWYLLLVLAVDTSCLLRSAVEVYAVLSARREAF
jgi:hypothetical protein